MDYAVRSAFERESVVSERKLIEVALRYGVGSATLPAVRSELPFHGIIGRERDGVCMVSTRDVLREEQTLLEFAREGRAACSPIAAGHVIQRDYLNPGQRAAVRHVLESTDRVTIVRGLAGTGKTTLTKEAVEAIEASGRDVIVVAPTAQAARGVLREEGFVEADTLQRFLVDRQFQNRLKNGVLWIDEAGLVSVRDMGRAMKIAGEQNARVVLMGDSKQHRSPGRGAALRLLEQQAGLVAAEVKEIKRQSGAYRDAVADLADGRTRAGFNKLDALGQIHEAKSGEQHQLLAKDYADAIGKGASVLVVSPTHKEGDRVTDAIRTELKRRELLGTDERELLRLAPLNLTEAERSDPVTYQDADSKLIVQFEQNAKGFSRGQRFQVVETCPEGIRICDDDGQSKLLPLDQAARFQVYRADAVRLAAGDKIRITHNGQTPQNKRLNNGAVYDVAGFTTAGDIALKNGWVLPKQWGFIAPGFVVTSHAAQGRTVDAVLISSSRESLPAISREQVYVSASRGRKWAAIYTDDKHAIREAAARPDIRIAASELFRSGRPKSDRFAAMCRNYKGSHLGPTPTRHEQLTRCASAWHTRSRIGSWRMTDNNLKAAMMERLGTSRTFPAPAAEDLADSEFVCWGFVRGNRRAFNIEFRRLQGAWPALEYAWLHYVAWCPVEAPFIPEMMAPAGSLILHYTNGYRVLVRGRKPAAGAPETP